MRRCKDLHFDKNEIMTGHLRTGAKNAKMQSFALDKNKCERRCEETGEDTSQTGGHSMRSTSGGAGSVLQETARATTNCLAHLPNSLLLLFEKTPLYQA